MYVLLIWPDGKCHLLVILNIKGPMQWLDEHSFVSCVDKFPHKPGRFRSRFLHSHSREHLIEVFSKLYYVFLEGQYGLKANRDGLNASKI